MAFQKIFSDAPEDEEAVSPVIDLKKLVRRRAERHSVKSISSGPAEPAKPSEETLLSWQASEFEKYEKGQAWFVLFGIAIVVLVIVSLIAKAILPAITFILLGAVTFIFSKKSPRDIKFSVRKDGVLIDKKLYRWSWLASFWIFYKPGEIKVLSLRSKKPLMPFVHLRLGNQSPAQLRRVMMKYLPEEEQEESRIDEIARKLKF